MNTSSNDPVMNHEAARQASAEQRLKERGIWRRQWWRNPPAQTNTKVQWTPLMVSHIVMP
jgi:hypothetical protein